MKLQFLALAPIITALLLSPKKILELLFNNESEIPPTLRPVLASTKQEFGILPPNMMNKQTFLDLGLTSLGYSCHNFQIPFTTNQTISIPNDANTIFIFNSTKSFPSNSMEFSKLISISPPFKLPHNIKLIDYFMVIPKKLLQTINDTLIYSDSDSFPLFRSRITDNKPAVYFMYDEEESTGDHLKVPNPFTTMFFDDFAVNWMKSNTYEKLIHSLFCSINSITQNSGYCIKISPSQIVNIFPAYEQTFELKTIEDLISDQKRDYNVSLAGLPIPGRIPKTLESLRLSIPRENYAQVLFEQPDFSEFSLEKRDRVFSNSSDCKKITWYNVFHYSIFGNIKFCVDDKK